MLSSMKPVDQPVPVHGRGSFGVAQPLTMGTAETFGKRSETTDKYSGLTSFRQQEQEYSEE